MDAWAWPQMRHASNVPVQRHVRCFMLCSLELFKWVPAESGSRNKRFPVGSGTRFLYASWGCLQDHENFLKIQAIKMAGRSIPFRGTDGGRNGGEHCSLRDRACRGRMMNHAKESRSVRCGVSVGRKGVPGAEFAMSAYDIWRTENDPTLTRQQKAQTNP